jgi:molybdopterin converting factor small subunit
MITIRLPASLRTSAEDLLLVAEDARSIAELVEALDRRVPGFRDQFEQGGFNFAVNDEFVLFRVRDRALHSGDVVEVVPTISGG